MPYGQIRETVKVASVHKELKCKKNCEQKTKNLLFTSKETKISSNNSNLFSNYKDELGSLLTVILLFLTKYF